jgi:phosphoglycolate phosphatase
MVLTNSCPDSKIAGVSSLASPCFPTLTDLESCDFSSNPVDSGQELTNQTKVAAVIFDLDGTLLNTLKDLSDCHNRVLVSQGFPPHPNSSYKYFIGDGARKCVERSLPEAARTEQIINRCVKLQAQDYANNWHVATEEYEGTTSLLKELSEHKIKIGVLSNKDHHFTELCIHHFFPNITFDVIQGHASGVPHKPDPSGALKIAAAMRLDSRDIVLLGDSAMDMMTAVAANMRGIGALWGFRAETELVKAGAAAVIDAPLQLLDLIAN